jgi:hypothetical protein
MNYIRYAQNGKSIGRKQEYVFFNKLTSEYIGRSKANTKLEAVQKFKQNNNIDENNEHQYYFNYQEL